MTPEARRQMVLYHEGQVMIAAGNHAPAEATETARAAVDGIVNGMMRLDGAEETAKYLFAVTDRVVARVRGVTPLPVSIFPPAPETLEGKLQAELNEGLRQKAAGLEKQGRRRRMWHGVRWWASVALQVVGILAASIVVALIIGALMVHYGVRSV